MPESPATLRKVCPEVPRYTGTVKLSAAFLSMKKPELKKTFLSVAWSMQAASATPQVGSSPDEARRTSQTKLAGMMGLRRESMCRRILQFSAPAVEWTEDHRAKNNAHLAAINAHRKLERQITPVPPQGEAVAGIQAEDLHPAADQVLLDTALGEDCVTGAEANNNTKTDAEESSAPVFDLPAGQQKPIFFHKSAAVGMPLFYNEAIARELAASGHRNPLKKENVHQDAENLAKAFGEEWFDRLSTWRGYVQADAWIFSEHLLHTVRCVCRKGQMKFHFQSECSLCDGKGFTIEDRPMGPNPRILLIVLQLLGIERHGVISKTQDELGEICGMSVGTIAVCQDEFEHLGLVETIPGDPIYEIGVDGKPVLNDEGKKIIIARKPQKLVWLPGKVLDHEMVEREKVRLNNALIVQAERVKMLDDQERRIKELQEIRKMHSDLLDSWRGTQRTVESVWKEMRFRMERANLSRDLYKALFPFYRE